MEGLLLLGVSIREDSSAEEEVSRPLTRRFGFGRGSRTDEDALYFVYQGYNQGPPPGYGGGPPQGEFCKTRRFSFLFH